MLALLLLAMLLACTDLLQLLGTVCNLSATPATLLQPESCLTLQYGGQLVKDGTINLNELLKVSTAVLPLQLRPTLRLQEVIASCCSLPLAASIPSCTV